MPLPQESKNKLSGAQPAELRPELKEASVELKPALTPEALAASEDLPKEIFADGAEKAGAVDKAIKGFKQLVYKPKKILPTILTARDELTERVEKIMEENLADAYQALDVVQQQEFKIKGEVTALAIRELLNKAKVKIKKIFQLILEWLLMLPGINRFYLEQEAKIKADRILALKNRLRGQG